MGKISNYTRALVAKLQDVFVVDQTDNNVTTTKSVTVEQIGNAICGEQVHADLETDDQTIIGGINENKDKVGDLSDLTTSDKSSLVGAVNEVDSTKANASDFEGCKMKGFVIAGGATVTVTGSTGIIVASANNNDATAGAYAFSNMGGTFRLKTLASGSGVTITATRTDGVITFTNGGASYIQGVIVYA